MERLLLISHVEIAQAGTPDAKHAPQERTQQIKIQHASRAQVDSNAKKEYSNNVQKGRTAKKAGANALIARQEQCNH